jgi:hypothetical protein
VLGDTCSGHVPCKCFCAAKTTMFWRIWLLRNQASKSGHTCETIMKELLCWCMCMAAGARRRMSS